jgi:hypothetical protein
MALENILARLIAIIAKSEANKISYRDMRPPLMTIFFTMVWSELGKLGVAFWEERREPSVVKTWAAPSEGSQEGSC